MTTPMTTMTTPMTTSPATIQQMAAFYGLPLREATANDLTISRLEQLHDAFIIDILYTDMNNDDVTDRILGDRDYVTDDDVRAYAEETKCYTDYLIDDAGGRLLRRLSDEEVRAYLAGLP